MNWVIASVVVAVLCFWVIKKFEPEGKALALLWTIIASCIGNIIFFALFGDMTKTSSPDETKSSLENFIQTAAPGVTGRLPKELKE